MQLLAGGLLPATSLNVHGEPEKVPEPVLTTQVTLPAGAVLSLRLPPSVTVAVHVVGAFWASDEGSQETVVSVGRRSWLVPL